MIDIENNLYTSLTDLLTIEFPKINYSSTFVNCPTSYPFVSIEEIDNYTNSKTDDSSGIEKFGNIVYEINVYTKENIKKKSSGKQIAKIIDNYMLNLGFERLSKTPMQGENESVYRIILRYSAIVSNKNEIFRR